LETAWNIELLPVVLRWLRAGFVLRKHFTCRPDRKVNVPCSANKPTLGCMLKGSNHFPGWAQKKETALSNIF
jgi:hypothetical protein